MTKFSFKVEPNFFGFGRGVWRNVFRSLRGYEQSAFDKRSA